jgi:glycosyltransferase involved in cell wall biosynthesis
MTQHRDLSHLRACWIGGTRYTQPLNASLDKKWRALAALDVPLAVIGFAPGLRPRRFVQHARFWLLPLLPGAPLRYLETGVIGLALLLYLTGARSVNVIIAQSPYEGAVAALAKGLARRFGRRVALVVESHGDFETVLFQQRRVARPALYRALMRRAAAFALRRADAIRAVSQATAEQAARWAPGVPVHRFMAWTDAEVFLETPRAAPPSAACDLIYAGVLTPLKGVHWLIEAFARLAPDFPQTRLWLAGRPENPDYARSLREQAKTLGLADRVCFTGALAQPELAAKMSQCRALVLPSRSEGLPRVVIEAMFAGLVPVASDLPGLRELVEPGVTGLLLPPGDVGALEAALRQVLSSAEVDAMGARARAFALSFFSAAAYVEGHRRLFEAVADAAAGL